MAGRRAGIVINSSVAQAAGRSDHPVSRRSRLFLDEVRRAGFYFVLSDALVVEWKNHASVFARQWRSSMTARKRINRLRFTPDEEFRDEILATARTPRETAEMSKDIHLLEAGPAG